jgi:hypothetical protein
MQRASIRARDAFREIIRALTLMFSVSTKGNRIAVINTRICGLNGTMSIHPHYQSLPQVYTRFNKHTIHSVNSTKHGCQKPNSSSDHHEIINILRIRDVHYRDHNSHQVGTLLSQQIRPTLMPFYVLNMNSSRSVPSTTISL